MTQQVARAACSAQAEGRAGAHGLPGEPDDRGLLEALGAGRDDAFDQLVRLAGGRMLAVARRMLGRGTRRKMRFRSLS